MNIVNIFIFSFMLKSVRKLFPSIIVITILSVAYYLFFPNRLSDDITLVIAPKERAHIIAKNLTSTKAIKNKNLFIFYSKLYSLYSPIKSGEYRIPKYSSVIEILSIISSGKSIIHKLSLPEGSTVATIISVLNQASILTGKQIDSIPEGTLMPDTYYYSYGDNRQQLISIMQNKMNDFLDKIMSKMENNSLIKDKNELLTLASIIEKETSIDDERPLIAAVFLNRLKKGMKLQADPTTCYAITLGKYKLNRALTKNDLATKSSYNTYYVNNLPPSPICCPGKKSIEAVINPAISKALYFVANINGGHNFSETLTEHMMNVKKYRELNNNLINISK